METLDNLRPITWPCGSNNSFECLPYQLSMVVTVPTMVTMSDGESGFKSGEGQSAEKKGLGKTKVMRLTGRLGGVSRIRIPGPRTMVTHTCTDMHTEG